jgi:hypothetical protein
MLRLGACEHHLSTDENEQYEFRILQAIYETREELRLVGGEFDVREGKTLEANWKLATATMLLMRKSLNVTFSATAQSPMIRAYFRAAILD